MTYKEKSLALEEFIKSMKQSWTYERMTSEEQTEVEEVLRDEYTLTETAIVGNFEQRWRVCNAIYHAYLMGLGYHNDPNWRS